MELFNVVDHTPVSLLVLTVGCVLVLAGPRNWVLPAFLTGCFLISLTPHLVIFGQNLMAHRVLIICAWIRILVRREHRGLELSALDKAFIAFCVWTVIGDTLLWQTVQAAVYQVANSIIDAMGAYFLFRILLNDEAQVRRLLACWVVLSIVLAGFMSLEYVTRRNWLTVLGALHEFVQVREGRFRAQAAFSVPITAGTFGAVLLPLFVSLWWQEGRMKRLALAGIIAATLITFFASSGGPLMAYVAAIFGLLMWPLRERMRAVCWSIAVVLLGMHLVMNAPVWALVARINVIPGSSGYHRYEVIDGFIHQFGTWWLVGAKSTENWGYLTDDVANHYCVVAKHGGILALLLFLAVIRLAFKEVGAQRAAAGGDKPKEIFLWGFGVMLWVHCVSFLGISYFDQIKVLWYSSLAMIGSLHLFARPREEPVVAAGQGELAESGAMPATSGIPLG